MKTTIILIFFLLVAPAVSIAETIYKSVDENGKVTYSATPLDDAETSTNIDIAPPPSQKAIKAAQDKHKRNEQAADILDENRKKRDGINAEENRLKREQKKQLQQQRQAEKNNENRDNIYPYIPGRRPGGTLPPGHGPEHGPGHRPVHLPAR
jgi:hypothetical protein